MVREHWHNQYKDQSKDWNDKGIRHLLSLHARLTLHNCLTTPLLTMETHCGVIDKNNDTLMGQLQVLQNKAAKVLLNLPPRSSSTEALKSFGRKYTLKKTTLPSLCYDAKILKISDGGRKLILNWTSIRRDGSFHSYLTRRNNDLHLPRVPIGASNQAS